MRHREGKIPVYTLALIAVLAVVLFAVEERNKVQIDDPYKSAKVNAAVLCKRGFEVIKDARDSLSLTVDRINDPNGTGLIGPQYSLITEGMSNLTEKLTTLNPNFSAAVVDMLTKCGVKEGDVLAIGWTGSYPAINIAVLAACEVLSLRPIIVTSVSSSMWGANIPSFTYLDMERILYEKGVFSNRSCAASIGGKDDVGIGLSPEGRRLIGETVQRTSVEYIVAKDIEESVKKRLAIYGDSAKIFINVGWGMANIGENQLVPGVNSSTRMLKLKPSCVAKEIADRGIPIINLVSFEKLAREYSLPIAPIPIPAIGVGLLYYKYVYSVPFAIVFILVIGVVLFISLKYEVEHIFRRDR
ncbi:hypothetical protein CH333_05825 [candidate division WOR-3 bacterium JGI_Cruoil_03_44_89]|uniref:Poly-gamma-glutamate system protein n=1 Tax=candidate division WOR-3 bacterium JGI_Cruoil_03_44_89 TaxID=1973748 RepID=A0A235BV13_UNCW3|nr:MAG: hypothetical protein CH333_05825 [candidate division WOR-3 bacterium JGI_Cruoil_03_44_89]